MHSRTVALGLTLLAMVAVSAVLPSTAAAQQVEFHIAIPQDVVVNVDLSDGSVVIITGGVVEPSPVLCAPGTPLPHNAVLVDPAGGRGSQRTDVLVFVNGALPDDRLRNGTRFMITNGRTCNSDFRLYIGSDLQ